MVDSLLLSQYLFSGLVIGVIYALMAVGITFIYSIMRMINWAMGEFYMLGSYLQYVLIVYVLGVQSWYIAVPLSMAGVFLIGVLIQGLLLKPMYVGGIERKDEYATVVTIGLMVLFRNLAIVLAGPYQYSPPDYYRPTYIGTLPVSGNRFVAFVGTLLILLVFYLGIKKTWLGRALRGAAQNRVGIQTAGVNVQRLDQLAFGIGVAFEIIVIGGLGSIPGSIVGGLLLGMVESLGSVFLSPGFRDVYGFLLLLALLAVRPTGLFGERERLA